MRAGVGTMLGGRPAHAPGVLHNVLISVKAYVGAMIDGRGTMKGTMIAGVSSLTKCLPRQRFKPSRDDRDDVF